MGLISGFYLVNLLCALVPCQGKWAPTESFIADKQAIRGQRNLSFNKTSTDPNPTVDTLDGAVQGYTMGTMSGRPVFAFEGIPYAEPPVGPLRFRAPLPKAGWNGVLRAMKTKPNCLQMNPLSGFRVMGSEDCLYLNIFTPKLPTQRETPLLPVVLFLHGGSYYFGGGGEYGPAYLLNKDIILVTVTFRQGVLGFLSTGDSAAPGNYGLKDQALAMKWVHENIEEFGGDKNRVTLMGQSTGGCSVHLHMVANVTRDYFQNAYTLSGSGFIHWALQSKKDALKWTRKLARLFACDSEDTQKLMSCMRARDPSFLVAYQMQLFEMIPLPIVLFAPTIESADDPEAFLTETPEAAYKRGAVAKKPWVVSVLTQEGHTSVYSVFKFNYNSFQFSFNKLTVTFELIRRNLNKYLPTLLEYKYLVGDTDKLTEKIWKFYMGNTKPTEAPNDFASEMATDRYFMVGIQKGIQAHSEIAPTYPMLFAFKGRFNSGGRLYGAPKQEWGLGHCEDLYYYFNASIYSDGYKRSEPEYELSQILGSLLHNFASRNEPLYTNEIGTTTKVWDAVQNPDNFKFLQINNDVKMVHNPYKRRVRFWESLGLDDATPWNSTKISIT